MTYYLFDNPVYFYAVAAISQIGAILFFFNSQLRAKFAVLLIGPLVLLLGLALDHSVETNKEQITALVEKIVSASVEPDLPAMLETMHPEINISGLDFDHLAAIIRRYLKTKQFSTNTIKSFKIIDDSDYGAKAEFTALTIFDSQGDYAMGGIVTSKWLFEFKKNNKDRFKIANMTMISLGESEPINVFTDTKYR